MCGRARCTLAREEVAKVAGVPPEDFVDGNKYNPVENMGPGRYGPILLQECRLKAESDTTMRSYLQAMRWGLVPSFTKASAKPDHFLMFNARSESLQDRPAFKRLLDTKRCVVLCEGYYEWQQVDKREKQPYYFNRGDVPMMFAGLYDQWKNEAGEVMWTYTILTTAVSPELKWLHSRMPVILTDEGVNQWLSRTKFEDMKDLLVSYRSTDLTWYPVDKKVGSMQFQGKECAEKVNLARAGDIKSFFKVKQETHEPIMSTQVTMEKKRLDDINMSKLEELDPKMDTSPKKMVTQSSTKFVPALSLPDKRSNDRANTSSPSELPSKRRRVSSPIKVKGSAEMGKLKSPADPKQSSLDFFFGKGSK